MSKDWMTTATPNRAPNNFNYRIAHSGNIVCNNGGYTTAMGSRGPHTKVLAKPLPGDSGEYLAYFGAHRDRVIKAAKNLNITIHRHTKKLGYEIFS